MELSVKAKDTFKAFIDNGLRTGGKIGLRGHYTGGVLRLLDT